MAIYHLSVKTLTRSKGHKAVAAAAYRSGSKLNDSLHQTTHDYSRRQAGILHSEIMAPENAPVWATERETLWNTVERMEKRKDSQVAREIVIALPNELDQGQNLDLVRHFVRDEIVSRGMIADCSIHNKDRAGGESNPHAHILLTMRRIGPDGFGPKERTWNETELVETWRAQWEEHCNAALEKAGHDTRIDHRTLEAQGILREPTIHLGKNTTYAEQRGIETARSNRQPSAVERSVLPFTHQIKDQGHVTLLMPPIPAQTWLEKTIGFGQKVAERAKKWYSQAREKMQSWSAWTQGRMPDDGPGRTR